jgi:methionine aminopeptidase
MTDGELAVIGLGSAGSMVLWQAATLSTGVVGFPARTPGHSSAPATKRSSTSSAALTATGLANTARSGSAARTPPQRDAYKQAREWMDRGIAGLKAGVGTDHVAALPPKAEEFGFGSEMEAFGLHFGHGLDQGLHERPIISRLNSMKEPVELQVGMVFAFET